MTVGRVYALTLVVGNTSHADVMRLAQEVEQIINDRPGSTEVVTGWSVAPLLQSGETQKSIDNP